MVPWFQQSDFPPATGEKWGHAPRPLGIIPTILRCHRALASRTAQESGDKKNDKG